MATNKEISKRESFKTICEAASIEPTPRQASKLRNKRGKLYNYLMLRRRGLTHAKI